MINAWKKSGKNKSQWSRDNGIPITTFHTWLSSLKKREKIDVEKFIEIPKKLETKPIIEININIPGISISIRKI